MLPLLLLVSLTVDQAAAVMSWLTHALPSLPCAASARWNVNTNLNTKLPYRVYNISTEVAEAEPFLGLPLCLPGTIEAEAYDVGGLGLGYGDDQPK